MLFLSVAFLFFVFFEKVLPDTYFAVFSALPDFEVDLCRERFSNQFLMVLLYILESFLIKNTNPTTIVKRNRVQHQLLQHVAAEDIFLDFEALLGLLWAPWGRFGVALGVPGGSKKGSKIKNIRLGPRLLVPSGLRKASWDHLGWIWGGFWEAWDRCWWIWG